MNTQIIIGSILLGLLSAPISLIKKPRFFWGSAAIDPISLFWIVAFFLYGPVGALVSSIIGAIAITLLSREQTPVLGALLKFTGTTTVWLTFYCALLLYPDVTEPATFYNDFITLSLLMLIAGFVRTAVEIPACYLAIPYFLTRSTKTDVSSQEMIAKFGGTGKFIFIMAALNFHLTVLDSVFPWLVVYPTGLYVKFAAW